jgi:hypothetical protein
MENWKERIALSVEIHHKRNQMTKELHIPAVEDRT